MVAHWKWGAINILFLTASPEVTSSDDKRPVFQVTEVLASFCYRGQDLSAFWSATPTFLPPSRANCEAKCRSVFSDTAVTHFRGPFSAFLEYRLSCYNKETQTIVTRRRQKYSFSSTAAPEGERQSSVVDGSVLLGHPGTRMFLSPRVLSSLRDRSGLTITRSCSSLQEEEKLRNPPSYTHHFCLRASGPFSKKVWEMWVWTRRLCDVLQSGSSVTRGRREWQSLLLT